MPTVPSEEYQAKRDLMLMHLKEAVRLGYSMATPGSDDMVRAAFPSLFALPTEAALVPTNDDLEIDDHPMVSRGDSGFWVNTWHWFECEADPE